jgi:hypothetical protein
MVTPSLPKQYQHLPLQEAIHLSQDDPAYPSASHFCTYEQFHGPEQELNLWLQWHFPDLGIKWKSMPQTSAEMSAHLIDYPTQTVATLKPSSHTIEIIVHGQRSLWSEILTSIQDWRNLGQPGREHSTLFIDQQARQAMKITHQGISRLIPLAEHRFISNSASPHP